KADDGFELGMAAGLDFGPDHIEPSGEVAAHGLVGLCGRASFGLLQKLLELVGSFTTGLGINHALVTAAIHPDRYRCAPKAGRLVLEQRALVSTPAVSHFLSFLREQCKTSLLW